MEETLKTKTQRDSELQKMKKLIADLKAEKLKKQKIEQALWESEKQFRSFVEKSPIGVYRTTLSGEILFVNKSLVDLCEFDDEEEMKAADVLLRYKNPDDRKELIRILTDQGYVSSFEFELITNKGNQRNVMLSATLDDDKISGMIVDATERIQNEKSLSLLLDISQKIATTINLNELLKIAVDKTMEITNLDQVSVVLVDEQGKGRVSAIASKDENLNPIPEEFDFKDFKLMNRAIEDRKFVSVSAESEPSLLNQMEIALLEKIGLSYLASIPLLARSRVFGLMNLGFKGKKTQISNREKLFFETIANQLSAMIANAKNYEKTKKAEEALRHSEKQFKTLFKDSPIALWEEDDSALKKHIDLLRSRGISDLDKYFTDNMEEVMSLAEKRKIVKINSAALNLFRARNKKELLDNADKVMTSEAYDQLKYWMVHVSQEHTDFEIESDLNTVYGDEIRVYTKIIIAPGYEDTLERVMVAFVDMTDRKMLEEELLKMQKLESIGVLAGGIAHDFNNLLTAMLGNISLARMQSQSNDLIVARLEEAEKAALRAKDLTHQLLTFSTGGIPIKKMTSITQLLKSSVEFTLRGSNVKCNYFISHDLWPVEIDEGQIGQVVGNIAINADQAMPDGGKIGCRAENWVVKEEDLIPLKAGKYVKITIEDQGSGMSQEHLQKIFDPYFTTKQKGSGLGLSTSYSIINNHNGYIKADSQMGEGTKITIYLPASMGVVAAEQVDEDKLNLGSGRILLMDDEDFVRDAGGAMLQALGYEAAFAANGEEAIRLYLDRKESGQPFDAVIMDLTIPGYMGGRETAEKLLELDPNATPIVSSGYSNDPIMANYSDYGFKAVIKKPFTLKELGDVLKGVLFPGE